MTYFNICFFFLTLKIQIVSPSRAPSEDFVIFKRFCAVYSEAMLTFSIILMLLSQIGYSMAILPELF